VLDILKSGSRHNVSSLCIEANHCCDKLADRYHDLCDVIQAENIPGLPCSELMLKKSGAGLVKGRLESNSGLRLT
jgi:hypothetical protein